MDSVFTTYLELVTTFARWIESEENEHLQEESIVDQAEAFVNDVDGATQDDKHDLLECLAWLDKPVGSEEN